MWVGLRGRRISEGTVERIKKHMKSTKIIEKDKKEILWFQTERGVGPSVLSPFL